MGKFELLPLSEKTNFLAGSHGKVLASLKSLLKLTLTSKGIVTSSEKIQCDRVAQRVAKLFSVNVQSTALEAISVKECKLARQERVLYSGVPSFLRFVP